MNFIETVKGSLLDGFYPAGWDMGKIDACCAHPPQSITQPQAYWNSKFNPIACSSLEDFEVMMGHEIALQIQKTHKETKELILIVPVGPMGMYRWAIYFLQEWGVSCDHVHSFNMDEWSDAEGNTLPPTATASFQYAMEQAFFNPLGALTIPPGQRNFATRENLPAYPEKIEALRKNGARQITVFGIGRMFHIAFWEPHFAAEFNSLEDWKAPTYRLGAKLHPMTIEQNAITSFKSRTTLIPCFANTIGPGIFMNSDWMIGGCDGALGRGMQWQGMSLWVTLRHGPDTWVPSSFIPTLPGKLFFLEELAGPLAAECN